MLPKKERLSVRDAGVLEKGKSVFGAHLSFRYSPAPSATPAKKFSVAVSKKVAKSAVGRNRIRRRVYAALREIKEKVRKPVFVMVMPKKECATIPLSEIKSELAALFDKAGLCA